MGSAKPGASSQWAGISVTVENIEILIDGAGGDGEEIARKIGGGIGGELEAVLDKIARRQQERGVAWNGLY